MKYICTYLCTALSDSVKSPCAQVHTQLERLFLHIKMKSLSTDVEEIFTESLFVVYICMYVHNICIHSNTIHNTALIYMVHP